MSRLSRAEAAAQKKAFNEAIGICKDVLESAPDCAVAFAIWGTIESYRGSPAVGAPMLERAIQLDPNQSIWYANISGVYRLIYRFGEAVAAARKAVQLAPDVPTNRLALGKVLTDIGEFDDAVAQFIDVLMRDPEHAEAHLAIGQILLARGNFRSGWIEYSWRNELEQAKGVLPKMTTPMWNGMSLKLERNQGLRSCGIEPCNSGLLEAEAERKQWVLVVNAVQGEPVSPIGVFRGTARQPFGTFPPPNPCYSLLIPFFNGAIGTV